MAVPPWTRGIVTRIEDATYNTKRFRICLPDLPLFDFLPGQFVTLDLPIHEKQNKRWRSYSIASWPDGTNEFELLIVLLEGGSGTTYLFKEIHEGSEIRLRGPQGVFTLPDPIDRDLFFICTGTGIAPFRSMIHHIHLKNVPHKNIYLIFGTRTQSDLLFADELKEMEKKVPGLHFIPTLSREKWDGCCGYVHGVYEDLIHKNTGSKGNLPPAGFYLCGWKDMIQEARKRIADLGYDKKEVHLELYG
jgi:CDP-4-dehydro-6-deoxyglucose reductase